MSGKHLIACAVLAALLASCATDKVLEATGGSRADGVVNLSYETGMFERPRWNAAEALATARQRCAAWGYSGAEPFGGQTTVCQSRDLYGDCLRATVTIPYQCTGR